MMKKKLCFMMLTSLLLALTCALAVADEPFGPAMGDATAPNFCDQPPKEVLAHIAERWDDWELEDYALIENTPDGDYAFALLNKGRTRMLVGYREKGGKMQYWLKSEAAVPQGAGPGWLIHKKAGEQVLDSRNEGNELEYIVSDGLSFCVQYYVPGTEGDYKGASYAWEGGGFTLKWFYDHGEYYGTAYVEDGYLEYWDWSWWRHDGNVEGVVQTELRYVDFAALPKTPQQARERLSVPPAIPKGGLEAQKVKFTGGQKYNVYTGPGETYVRSGNGKGSVSTNDWIQVFGEHDGYILIQYDINADHFRIGWIDAKALPDGAQIDAITFDEIPATIVKACALTDDPLQSGAEIAKLEQGTGVTLLTALGDWRYVRAQAGGGTMCGFVPADCTTWN